MRIASRNIARLIVHQNTNCPYEGQFGIGQQTIDPRYSGGVYSVSRLTATISLMLGEFLFRMCIHSILIRISRPVHTPVYFRQIMMNMGNVRRERKANKKALESL